MATKLASAYIDITVHFSNAMDDIVRNAERAGDEAERRLKRKFKDGIEVEVDADTAEAEAKITKTTRDRTVNVDVDVDARGAENTLDRLTRRRRDTVNLRANVDVGDAGKQLGVLTRGLENVARSDIFRVGLGAGLIGSIPSVVYGLTEVAAAMQKVAQVGIALPGILAGAGASFGTLLAGLSGIGDAFEAVVAANKEMASGQSGSASAARSAQSAQNSLRNALVDQERATGNLSDAYRSARRNLEDLQTQMRGGAIDAKQAALDVQVAWENLNSGNYTDRRQAVLDYEQAVQREAEVTQNNIRVQEDFAAAQAKGIEGSDQVVAARDAVTQSNQRVADALAQVAENTNKTTSAQQKANDAMGELSPNAQALVNSLTGIYDQVIDLRNNISQTMLEGVPDGLEGLFAKALPHVNAGTQAIAGRWNEMIHEMLNVLGTDKNLSLIDRIFGNTSEAMARLKPVIDPLVNLIGTITGTGSDFLPRIADALGTVVTRFDAFITRASENGDLKRWIDEGLTAVGDLGGIALNIAKMVGAFTSAADGNFLGWLREVTDKWATWMNSSEGQQKIRDFLQQGKTLINDWKPLIEKIPGAFMDIVDACRILLNDYILPVARAIDALPGGIETVVAAFAAWKTIQGIAAVSTAITSIGTLLGALPGKAGTAGAGMGDNLKKGMSSAGFALGAAGWVLTASVIIDVVDDQIKNRKFENEYYGGKEGNLTPAQWERQAADNPEELQRRHNWIMTYLAPRLKENEVLTDLLDDPLAWQRVDQFSAPWGVAGKPEQMPIPDGAGGGNGPHGSKRGGPVINKAPGEDTVAPPAAPASASRPDLAGANAYLGQAANVLQQNFPWLKITSGRDNHSQDRGWHPKGQAIDISGGTPEQMAQLANFLNQFSSSIEQLIFQGPGVSQNILGGKLTPAIDMPGSPYTTSEAGYHGDHVHLAVKEGQAESFLSAIGAGGVIPGMTPSLASTYMPGDGSAVPVFVINWPGGGMPNAAFPGGGAAGGAVHSGTGAAPGPSLWDEVAQYESNGNWANADTGQNGHYGGLQFSPETWKAYGGEEFAPLPHLATREQQIEVANRTAFTGYGDTKPQGLGAWEVITKGLTPNVTTDTPQSAFMPPPPIPGAPAPSSGAPHGSAVTASPSGALMPALPASTANVDMASWRQQISGGPVPGRTEGAIPAAAGHSGASGNSFLSGIYDMGAQAINGVIDQAASVASSAAGMALTAGTMGAAAPAGPAAAGAAQAAIGMGTQAAKRGVQYGADLLGIWTDALIEQATPFGAPRWISTDPTAFMPTGLMEAATTSVEKAMQDIMRKDGSGNPAKPGDPVPGSSIPPLPGPQVPGGPASGPGGEFDPESSGVNNDYSVHLNGVTVTDVKQLTQQAKDQQSLQIMRHAGRP
ncbi:tape measure protein [Mycobacterium phage LilSpotty]|uniref:Tape measure protein n=1 Tax=Mycobacterium phage LilSpotty TaxID=2588512 RepID=A0A4Y6ENX1_9CAUD|nr:tape measure protein [Mycobacterium phage LilSpotty]QDF19747.1 tape measure protein [Mycobacterium phage LilSpotty]